MISLFYRSLTILAAPVIAALFMFSQRGRRRLPERFGFWSPPNMPASLWIHGASQGEIRGITPILDALLQTHELSRVLVTSTSPEGLDVLHAYACQKYLLPFDNRLWYRCALASHALKILLIVETEIWPELYRYCREQRIRVIIINGRISDYSITGYRRMLRFFPEIVEVPESVLAGDKASAERFAQLGYSNILLSGSTKYDRTPSIDSDAARIEMRDRLGVNGRRVLVLGSIWPGEEEGWLKSFVNNAAADASCALIVAPRHLEKIDFFAEALRSRAIEFVRLSQCTSERSVMQNSCILVDGYGELEQLYSIASLAFIGGSLVDVGGHNPLEAAAYHVPLVMGPYISTIQDIAEQLKDVGGLSTVRNGEEVERIFYRFLAQDPSLKESGEAAAAVAARNHGATQRVLNLLKGVPVVPLPGEVLS
jgi:3-deoxy-D-manno-octulosonic-acid transferase